MCMRSFFVLALCASVSLCSAVQPFAGMMGHIDQRTAAAAAVYNAALRACRDAHPVQPGYMAGFRTVMRDAHCQHDANQAVRQPARR